MRERPESRVALSSPWCASAPSLKTPRHASALRLLWVALLSYRLCPIAIAGASLTGPAGLSWARHGGDVTRPPLQRWWVCGMTGAPDLAPSAAGTLGSGPFARSPVGSGAGPVVLCSLSCSACSASWPSRPCSAEGRLLRAPGLRRSAGPSPTTCPPRVSHARRTRPQRRHDRGRTRI